MIKTTAPGNVQGDFVEENLAFGQQPTVLEAAWLNMMQNEMLNVLVRADIAPSAASHSQVADAIQQLIAQGIPEQSTDAQTLQSHPASDFLKLLDVTLTESGNSWALETPWIVIQGGKLLNVELYEMTFHSVSWLVPLSTVFGVYPSVSYSAGISGTMPVVFKDVTGTGCKIFGDGTQTSTTGDIHWLVIGKK